VAFDWRSSDTQRHLQAPSSPALLDLLRSKIDFAILQYWSVLAISGGKSFEVEFLYLTEAGQGMSAGIALACNQGSLAAH
jgi:hypothetical protein